MIGSITSYIAGVRVNGSVYRVECAPDGPCSPVWMSDDAVEGQVCSCCGKPLVDFSEPEEEEFGDGMACRFCGDELGFEEDSAFCSDACAVGDYYASRF